MSPMVVVTVDHRPGGRLANGSPSGVGGETRYGLALTTNGIDRQPIPGGRTWDKARPAHRAADALQRQLDEESSL
jgi:hypothetical protein